MGCDTKLKLLGKVPAKAIANFISAWPEVRDVKSDSISFGIKGSRPISGLEWVKLIYGDSTTWDIEQIQLTFKFGSESRDLMVLYDNVNSYENLEYYQQLALKFPNSKLIEMVKAETTALNLGFWGHSEEIMRRIAEHFAGGWLDVDDCDGTPEIWVPSKTDMAPTFSTVKTLEEFLAARETANDKCQSKKAHFLNEASLKTQNKGAIIMKTPCFIPAKDEQMEEDALTYVAKDGFQLVHIKKALLSEAVCRKAVTTSPLALSVVPEQARTNTVCSAALEAAEAMGNELSLSLSRFLAGGFPASFLEGMTSAQMLKAVRSDAACLYLFYDKMQPDSDGNYSSLAWDLALAAALSGNTSVIPPKMVCKALMQGGDELHLSTEELDSKDCANIRIAGHVASLKALYGRNRILYWCNACGDVNLPGEPESPAPGILLHSKDMLPKRILTLYEKFWSDDFGANLYVVTIDGIDGMAAAYLLDRSWVADILDEADYTGRLSKEKAWETFTTCAKDYASKLATKTAEGKELEHASILFGDDTEPDGHEIMIFIPADHCEEQLENIIKATAESLYHEIESDFISMVKDIIG